MPLVTHLHLPFLVLLSDVAPIFFWVDGCNGDVCTYTVSISGNTGCDAIIPRPVPPIIVSNTTPEVCDEIDLSWQSVCAANVLWFRDGRKVTSYHSPTLNIPILDTTSFEMCAHIYTGTEYHTCDSVIRCVTIHPNSKIEFSESCMVLCENQLPYLWHGEYITEACINPPCTVQIRGKNDCLFDSVKSFYVVETGEFSTIDTIVCGPGAYTDGAGKVWRTGVCQEYISWSIEKSHPDCESAVLCDTGYLLNLSFLKIDVDLEKSCSACSGELELCFDIDYNLDCFLTPLDRSSFEFVLIEGNSTDSIFFNELYKCIPIDSVGRYRLLYRHTDLKKCSWELIHFFSVNDRDFRDPEIRFETNTFCKSDTIAAKLIYNEILCAINWWVESENARIVDRFNQREIQLIPDHAKVDSMIICFSALTDCMTLDSLCHIVYLIDPMENYLHIENDSICGDSLVIHSTILLSDLEWRKISGPGQLTFMESGDYHLNSRCTVPGTYKMEFRSKIDDCITWDTLSLLFIQAPIAVAEIQQDECTFEFSLKALDTINRASWEVKETPQGENVIYLDSTSSVFSGQVTGPGNYKFLYSISNGICSDSIEYCIQFAEPIEYFELSNEVLNCRKKNFTKYIGSHSRWRHELDIAWNSEDSLADHRFGKYYIEFFNSDSSCSLLDSFIVLNDEAIPEFDIHLQPVLNCDTSSIEIDIRPLNFSLNEVVVKWSLNGIKVDRWNNQLKVQIRNDAKVEIKVSHLSNGCLNSQTVSINIPQHFREVIYGIIDPDCQGNLGEIVIDTLIGGFPPYRFYLDGKTIDQSQLNDLSAGEYYLEIIDSLGCPWQRSIQLEETGEIDIGLIDDFEVPYQSDIRLDSLVDKYYLLYPFGYDSIQWINGQTFQIISKSSGYVFQGIEEHQILILRVFHNGCMAEDVVRLRVVIKKKVWMPNVITPDADNGNIVNKYLSIHIQKERIKYIEFLRVYDRWGELIYQMENVPYSEELGSSTEGWDGTLNGVRMNPGVFVYHARVHFITNEVEELVGDVTLLR